MVRREDWSALVVRPLECVRGFPAKRSSRCASFVSVRRSDLDRRLAAGGDPASDLALEFRAAQLCTVDACRVIAARLHGVACSRPRAADLMVARGLLGVGSEIFAESVALMDFVVRLVGHASGQAEGVALANVFVTDADSPLRVGAQPGTLDAVVRLATVALDSLPAHASPGATVTGSVYESALA